MDGALADTSTGQIRESLLPFADALKQMERANSGLTWIRQPHVQQFLRRLATIETITHEEIDSLPRSRTRQFVRALLVEHGVLPRRDERRVIFDGWADDAVLRVRDPSMRLILHQYLTWFHKHQLNEQERISRGTFYNRKQNITVAAEFLNWLDSKKTALGALTQSLVDEWASEDNTTRLRVDQFLMWAARSGLVDRRFTLVPHRRGVYPLLSLDEQQSALAVIASPEALTPRDRAIGILVLVLGQRLEDVVKLTWEDLEVTADRVSIRVAKTPIELPEPLDEPWRLLEAGARQGRTASHPHTSWIFRGYSPGQPLNPAGLADHLKRVFAVRAARLGTLHELSKSEHVPVIAEVLGYSPATIVRHQVGPATAYGRYIAAIRDAADG